MPKVTIVCDDLELECDAGTPLRDLLDESDASVVFGCRSAICGACLFRVEEGAENLDPPGEDERDYLESMGAAKDERLACQCVVQGSFTMDID